MPRKKQVKKPSKPLPLKLAPNESRVLRSSVRIAAKTSSASLNGSNQTMALHSGVSENCLQNASEKLVTHSRQTLNNVQIVRSLRSCVHGRVPETASILKSDNTEKAKAPGLVSTTYSLRPRKTVELCAKSGPSYTNKVDSDSERKVDVESVLGSGTVTTACRSGNEHQHNDTFVVPYVVRGRRRLAADMQDSTCIPSANCSPEKLRTVLQPIICSTPMKNVLPRNHTDTVSACMTILQLSPIKSAANDKKPVAKSTRSQGKQAEKPVQNENKCPKGVFRIEKPEKTTDSRVAGKALTECTVNSRYKMPLKDCNWERMNQAAPLDEFQSSGTRPPFPPNPGATRDYTRTPRKTVGYFSSDSTNSDERDPLTLFILNDPIKLNNLRRPKDKNYQFSKHNWEDGCTAAKRKKANPKKTDAAANCNAQNYARVQSWLEEVKEFNAVLEDVEKMELCIE